LSYDTESKGFVIVYLSRHVDRRHHVNLLLLEEEGTSNRHYVLVRDMSRLISHRSKHNGKTFTCDACLNPFSSRTSLDNHISFCYQHAPQQTIYPDANNENERVLKFSARNKQHPVPFYIVSDLECFLVPNKDHDDDDDDDDVVKSYRIVDEHQVSGFCCYRVTEYEQYQTPPTVYSGPDPISKFYEHIMSESKLISEIVSKQVPMKPLTSQQQAEYRTATACANCNKQFTHQNYKVKHHDHISGLFLFAACNNCNLQLKPSKCHRAGNKRSFSTNSEQIDEAYRQNFFLPVLFHNGKNYDSHFLLKAFHRRWVEHQDKNGKISFHDVRVIPQNDEKFISFQIGNVRFLDTFQFLPASLDELVSLLLKSGKANFVHTRKHLHTDDDIIFRKGTYPYSYMTSRDKFLETSLPPIEDFYDRLRDEPVTQDDYDRAQQTWTRFGITNMEEYHNHYLLTDVLLLCDVFQSFRQSVMDHHRLDCLHFFTLPSLSWAMALKHTDVKLELITDPDMYLLIENNMRGGISTISQRYASANKPVC